MPDLTIHYGEDDFIVVNNVQEDAATLAERLGTASVFVAKAEDGRTVIMPSHVVRSMVLGVDG